MIGLGTQELIIILIIAILLFGPSRLAGLGGALGKAIKEFRGSVKDVDEELKGGAKDGETRRQEPRT
ncbi:MAG: twin-arginine translocase TatA/TatE family subunit [Armatimonadetes bacterium]|nr:twin-arginine translocase TatA/TatE family subunit [Armatimonadota bacterium]